MTWKALPGRVSFTLKICLIDKKGNKTRCGMYEGQSSSKNMATANKKLLLKNAVLHGKIQYMKDHEEDYEAELWIKIESGPRIEYLDNKGRTITTSTQQRDRQTQRYKRHNWTTKPTTTKREYHKSRVKGKTTRDAKTVTRIAAGTKDENGKNIGGRFVQSGKWSSVPAEHTIDKEYAEHIDYDGSVDLYSLY